MNYKEIDNPYLDSRNDWNEIYAKEKVNAIIWRRFGIVSIAITFVAVLGMIYAASLPKTVPFLFKEDASGGITALGIPNQALRIDNRIIANQLAIFIEKLRQVPSSTEMRMNYVRQVKMMSSSNLFNNQLSLMLRDSYANMGDGELVINVTTILPVAKDTWQIDWQEFKNGIAAGKYRATINYARNSTNLNNPKELIWNPVGIIVKDININRVIGS
ncbi:MAG: type secretion system protein TrbF [Pseudomonadota bacterium]|nr:type secretion system protein TrbF [Pseudomonadota bacterium]